MTLAVEAAVQNRRPPSLVAMTYDEEKRELTVRFMVGCYVYSDIPPEKGKAVQALSGEALTWAFDSGIEGKYASRRIGT